MTRTLTCIICPRGCTVCAQITSNGAKVTGNACPRGEEYAINECTNPVRTVTATVRVSNRDNTMVSVKTSTPVSKNSMMTVMECLRKTSVVAPVHIGDVILHDVCGADIIITKDVL